jgi:hypothetical protein
MDSSWLFLAVFGPLMLASLLLCGDSSSWRTWRTPAGTDPDLDRDGQRELARFLRSKETVPDPSIAPAVIAWAEHVLSERPCVWDRITNWAWVLWITAGVVTALAFGGPRDVAPRLLVFDLMLLVIAIGRIATRRAHSVLRR